MLLRPRNAGFMVHREAGHRGREVYTDDDIVGTAPWEPILEEDLWRSVVAKLTDPTASAAASTTSPAVAAASSAQDSQDGPSRNVPVEMMPVAITYAK